MTVAFAAAAAVTDSAEAAGANYTVYKCHTSSRSSTESFADSRGPYATSNRCPAQDQRLEISNSGFGTAGQQGVWRFSAPPGAQIIGVRVHANLRRDNHHLAQLGVINDQGTGATLLNGSDAGTGFQYHQLGPFPPQRSLVMTLVCAETGGCPASSVAHAYMKNIEIVLVDQADPIISNVSGSLLAPGWLRDVQNVVAQAGDSGSGLETLSVSVNGTLVARANTVCGGVLGPGASGVFSPCPPAPGLASVNPDVDTAAPPFSDGENAVVVCTRDFAGNQPACAARSTFIDNEPPQLAFANNLDSENPELLRIAVNEPHSGLVNGLVRARPLGSGPWQPLETETDDGDLRAVVDSSASTPGEYEFKVEAIDAAGNTGSADTRADGRKMILRFPLRTGVEITGGLGRGEGRVSVLRYGGSTEAAGRITTANGAPLPGVELRVDEFFGSGALIDHRVRYVSSDADGRWASELPPGPSRTVSVTFAGSRKYQPIEKEIGELVVRSRATFRSSRTRVPEGGAVMFSGKVGHLGANVPVGGKLLELQVRQARGQWDTVREAFHTRPNGHFRFGYRFGDFYDANAGFRFRVKIAREQGWPFKAPVRSRPRSVTVIAK